MIVDARSYTVQQAAMPAFLERVEQVGLPLQKKYGYDLAGYFTVETGELNTVVHYWKWANAAERQEKRRALNADPEWTDFRRSNAEIYVKQSNRLLTATDVVEPFKFMGNGSEFGFVDERTYTITYGQVPHCVALTKMVAWPIIERAGWQLIGYFFSI
ncbi:MAG: NIPSNAP family protein, partial [Alphaproteobacteria bacterium]